MTAPKRIQRKRTKGWRTPEGAVYVGRPTKWGNPFKVGARVHRSNPLAVHIDIPGGWDAPPFPLTSVTVNAGLAVDAYFDWLLNDPPAWLSTRELAGKDLVCWCPLDQPCHADVLLEIANDTP